MAQKYRSQISGHSVVTALLFTTLLWLISNPIAHAEEVQHSEWLPEATATIKEIENRIKNTLPESANVDTLSGNIKEINQIRSRAQECIAEAEQQLLKVNEDLATLGDPLAKESPEVVKKRKSFLAQ
nr:hypothetical protein [Spirochaetales bacterium]